MEKRKKKQKKYKRKRNFTKILKRGIYNQNWKRMTKDLELVNPMCDIHNQHQYLEYVMNMI